MPRSFCPCPCRIAGGVGRKEERVQYRTSFKTVKETQELNSNFIAEQTSRAYAHSSPQKLPNKIRKRAINKSILQQHSSASEHFPTSYIKPKLLQLVLHSHYNNTDCFKGWAWSFREGFSTCSPLQGSPHCALGCLAIQDAVLPCSWLHGSKFLKLCYIAWIISLLQPVESNEHTSTLGNQVCFGEVILQLRLPQASLEFLCSLCCSLTVRCAYSLCCVRVGLAMLAWWEACPRAWCSFPYVVFNYASQKFSWGCEDPDLQRTGRQTWGHKERESEKLCGFMCLSAESELTRETNSVWIPLTTDRPSPRGKIKHTIPWLPFYFSLL